jgi:group I intron endonuclease
VHDLSQLSLPVERRSGIYAFQHKAEGKIYVGQSKNVSKRRGQHERGGSGNSRRFHNAMVAHGAEAFNFYVLEYCDVSLLDEREASWIEKLGSLHPQGYNLKSGGGAIHGHHAETKEVMRQRQVAKVEAGDHPFASAAFQSAQAERQRKQVEEGVHPSQDPVVQAKRRKTVSNLIDANGKFFSHTPEQLEQFRGAQTRLYEQGLGKFQQPEFIAANQARVQRALEEGTHFSQQDGWSERARSAASKQMKPVCLAVRHSDGSTSIHSFDSLHAAEAGLQIDRSHLSSMCNGKARYKSLTCMSGLVIKACFGVEPDWNHDELAQEPTIHFLATKPVLVTIELADGSITQRSYLSQRSACSSLDAHHRAFRWIIKGEKYKSTGCNLGKIIGVVEIDPLPEHIEEMIAASKTEA